MNPDYSNSRYGPIRYSLNRKRQIINAHLEELHAMHMSMIEQAVQIKEHEGFPEAAQVINYIKSL